MNPTAIARGIPDRVRYTVIVVPGQGGMLSVSVPAMPGCFTTGATRDDALKHAREAIEGWIEAEAAQGRTPLIETPAVISAGVSSALEIIEEIRRSGEAAPNPGYELELATVEVRHRGRSRSSSEPDRAFRGTAGGSLPLDRILTRA